MNMHRMKRILSFVLAMTLLLSNIPAVVFAAEEATSEVATEPTTVVTEPFAEETMVPTQPVVPAARDTEPVETMEAPEEAVATEMLWETAPAAMAVAETSGSCGENLIWSYENGVLTISGTGEMEDYTAKNGDKGGAPWGSYHQQIQRLVVEEGVTRIGAYAFYGCSGLSQVEFPSTLTEIADIAFWNCDSLTYVEFPEHVTTLGESVMGSCDKLVEIRLPEGLTVIPYYAFRYNRSLTTINLPEGITKIDAYAFADCNSLRELELPESLQSLGEYTFANGTALERMAIPSAVMEIPAYTFSGCSGLQEVILPEGLTDIGEEAFYNCHSLKTADFPTTLLRLGSEAFRGCNALLKAHMPAQMQSVGDAVFYGCRSLKEVSLPEQNVCKSSIFQDCQALTEITIPAGWTKIPDYFFYLNEHLTRVTFLNPKTNIGIQAFRGCTNLTDLQLPAEIERIDSWAFAECKSLREVVLPATLKRVDYRAFSSSGITKLTILGTETSFILNALEGCRDLTTVIAENLHNSGRFGDLKNLTTVVFGENLRTIQDNAFEGCAYLTTVVLPEKSRWDDFTIDYEAFEGCVALKNITLPENTAKIGSLAFSGCTSLTEISLPEGLTELGDQAFLECTSLAQVSLPESLTTIGRQAFRGCTLLENMVIPKGVLEIGSSIFHGCPKITAYELAPGNPNFRVVDDCLCSADGTTLLSYPYGKTGRVFTVPAGIECIDSYAFYGVNLTCIVMQEGVTQLNSDAIDSCDALKEIYLPESLAYTDQYAIDSCKSLTDIYYGGTEEQWNGNGYFCTLLNKLQDYREDGPPWLHCNIKGFGSFGNGFSWLLKEGRLTIFGSGPMRNYASGEETPWGLHREEIREIYIDSGITRIGEYTFAGCVHLDKVVLPKSLSSVASYAFKDCDQVTQWIYTYPKGDHSGASIGSGNDGYIRDQIRYECPPDAMDNDAITIEGSGSAYAYYITKPNVQVEFTVDGKAGSSVSDEHGVFQVPLGSFEKTGKYELEVAITSVNGEKKIPAYETGATVTVSIFRFTQQWDASLDTAAAASLGLQAGGDAGVLQVDIALGRGGLKLGKGTSLKITSTRDRLTEKLEVLTDKRITGGASVESGVSVGVLASEYDLADANMSGKGTVTGTYGISIDRYGDFAHQEAVGHYLLNEILNIVPNNMLVSFYSHSKDKSMYQERGFTTIEGSGVGVSGEKGAALNKLVVNDVHLYSEAGENMKTSTSFGKVYRSDGTSEFSAEYKTEPGLDALWGQGSIDLGLLGRKYLTTDVSVKVENDNNGIKVEATALDSDDTDLGYFVIGNTYSKTYNRYTFREEALEKLLADSTYLKDYTEGKVDLLRAEDIQELAAVLSSSDVPIPYSRESKEQTLFFVPLDFGGGIILKGKLVLDLSYLEGTSYTSATGFALNDKIYLTSVLDDMSGEVDAKKRSLENWFMEGINSLKAEIEEFFQSVSGSIQEGVDAAEAWIDGKIQSVQDFTVSITTTVEEITPWSARVRAVAPAGGSRSNVARKQTQVATIGKPYVITVTNNATGQEVEDFRDDPLTFHIRYTEEELQAAGLSSAVLQENKLALYRYSDEGDYFEFVGGTVDPVAMTVTAQLTKPGQYILATDDCGPVLRDLTITEPQEQAIISAVIEDMSGVAMFEFCLDGEIRVTNENLADFYDRKTGIFTYTIPQNERLEEGKHTVSFALSDTSGNENRYEYPFAVDRTAPKLENVEITGHCNAGDLVKIRVKIVEENITGVYATFRTQLPDGSWTPHGTMDMIQLEDGIWALDYTGSGDCVKIQVYAEDIVGNRAQSEETLILPALEQLVLKESYRILYKGQSVQLIADVQPAGLMDAVAWSVEAENEGILSVDENGNVTAHGVGTGYVIVTASDGEKTMRDRCRIDVVEAIQLNGVQLGSHKVNLELYKNEFATFEILLDLPQNHPVDTEMISNSAANAGAKKSNIIDSVAFKTISDLFELEMLDDRTVQIVPTQKALDSGKTVKSSYTDTVIVTIQGKEYPITEKLTLAVKKTLPKLKATIAAFNSFYEGQAQEIVITGTNVTGIRANGDQSTAVPTWLMLENGCLKLNGNTPKSSDKAYLWIDVDGWRVPTELTLSVKHSYKAPTLKLPATSVSLNSLNGDKKEIVVTSSFVDYVPDELDITSTAGDALTIEKEGNRFTVSTNEKTAHNKTYKITIATSNPKIKAVSLTVKTVGKAPTMNSLKLKGTLDVTFPANKLTIGVSLKDYADAFTPTLIIKDSKGNDVTEQFTAQWNGAEFEVAPNGAVKGTYNVSVTALGLEKTAKLTVKETLPKIKLSATKVTLNKNLNHSVEIDITSATKGYEMKTPVHVEAPAQVKAVPDNGKLTISLNESAEYGKTYKITVSAYKGAPAVSLSVAVPKKDKSDVSATIKATGFIDVIRGNSAITITPTFVNAYASDMESMELRFYKRNGKVWEDVTEAKYFDAQMLDGKFIVTAEENLTSADKYQAELVYKVGGKELKSKQIALTIKMGTAKVMVKSSDTTMFAKDRNDRALVWFESTDTALNGVAKIEIKDAKYKDAFTIIDYEDGTFGLAFKDGKIHKEIEKLIAKKSSTTITLNLNVFIDGNTTTKANATQKVTLTIVK